MGIPGNVGAGVNDAGTRDGSALSRLESPRCAAALAMKPSISLVTLEFGLVRKSSRSDWLIPGMGVSTPPSRLAVCPARNCDVPPGREDINGGANRKGCADRLGPVPGNLPSGISAAASAWP